MSKKVKENKEKKENMITIPNILKNLLHVYLSSTRSTFPNAPPPSTISN